MTSPRAAALVKIWLMREGAHPTVGEAAYTLPLEACVEKLGLLRAQWMSSVDRTPRFTAKSPDLAEIAGYQHVVCEIDDPAADASGWRAGFYRISLSPEETVSRLGPPMTPFGA